MDEDEAGVAPEGQQGAGAGEHVVLAGIAGPTWVDKQQRPIQNTYHDDVERFHRLGTQLLLDLDPPDHAA